MRRSGPAHVHSQSEATQRARPLSKSPTRDVGLRLKVGGAVRSAVNVFTFAAIESANLPLVAAGKAPVPQRNTIEPSESRHRWSAPVITRHRELGRPPPKEGARSVDTALAEVLLQFGELRRSGAERRERHLVETRHRRVVHLVDVLSGLIYVEQTRHDLTARVTLANIVLTKRTNGDSWLACHSRFRV